MMKRKIFIALLFNLTILGMASAQTMHENSTFKFRAAIPEDWRFHQEQTDSVNYTITAWGMPKVYSEMEKHDVENSVSITAVKNRMIKSVDDLVNAEFRRTKNMMVMNRVKTDSIEHTAYITNTISGSTSYVTKQYFIVKDGIGYIIGFTATLGTFSINIAKFEEFHKTVVLDD